MSIPSHLRLGVNVDHVATLRQARGTEYPDPVAVAELAVDAGAEGITVHLREDRRHIQPHDVERLMELSRVPVNLEMAVTDSMLEFAEGLRPPHVCLVPERRQELTTEGGLDVGGQPDRVRDACDRLRVAGCRVSLFIDPDHAQIEAAQRAGAPAIELHTGAYADASDVETRSQELRRLAEAARLAHMAGLEVHAGHGLTTANVGGVAALSEIVELNIGHALIARAVSLGIAGAVQEMRAAMEAGRGSA